MHRFGSNYPDRTEIIKIMAMNDSLKRFIDAQEASYSNALSEIKNGRKRSHWMWYIFPQVKGLGFSETSRYYAIDNVDEATAFINHPILGRRLIDICRELLKLETDNANEIFGNPDDLKLKSSMTLFASLPGTDPVFQSVLDKFFQGVKDQRTLEIIENF
jgi:uncharacterized protein (DUF1810 family)